MFDLERITVKEAAEFCESKTSLSGFIERISTDSRDVDENTLFVALRGERFDANDFVPDVLKKGAKAAAFATEQKNCYTMVKKITDFLKMQVITQAANGESNEEQA